MPSVLRPKRVEIITPTQTNDANSARQITTSMARFHSESPVP